MTYDVAIQWPKRRHDWHEVTKQGVIPLYARPKGLDPEGGTVWIAWSGELVGSFQVEAIRDAKVQLLTGGPRRSGVELVVRPRSLRRLKKPRPINKIADPEHLRSIWPGGAFKHMNPGATAFAKSPASRVGCVELTGRKAEILELGIQKEWMKATSVQRQATQEHLAFGVEARLVADYGRWLEARRGSVSLTRHRITLSDGAVLLSDAWDAEHELLIEAKAHTDRPSIRMAIGQLLDYSHSLGRTVALAVLLPSKPSKNLLALLDAQDIAAIWQTSGGKFSDSRGGQLSR